MRRLFRTVICLLMILSSAIAQTDASPQFEVASIKPAAPDARGMFIRTTPGGRVNITNMTLKELIVIAWRIQRYQISGGPAWLDSAHYDITAKPETSPKQGELPLMLQSLLADRFQLTIHRETKELPVYALVVAKKDGKLGPGLTESKEGSCTPPDPSKPPPPPQPGKPSALPCGGIAMRVGLPRSNVASQPGNAAPTAMAVSSRRLTAVSVPVANLTPMLSGLLARTVVDKTGLTGKFDVSMEWAPDETQAMQLPPGAPTPPPSDFTGPSIFTALQEQLGLKLESQKGPVEIFVIERAEKPSEN